MRAVMISIQPKWVEKILNGEKTIEVRKTMPQAFSNSTMYDLNNGTSWYCTPFKVYVYCTNTGRPLVDGQAYEYCPEEYRQTYGYSRQDAEAIWNVLNGKVVAEFTCDRIECAEPYYDYLTQHKQYPIGAEKWQKTCLSYRELMDYGDQKPLYLWHISDLKIYDKPRELGEFYSANQCKDWDKNMDDCVGHGLDYQEKCKQCSGGYIPLTRPFQSWGYIEDDM